MPKRGISDAEIKADIMNRLLRKHCWGAKYLPVIHSSTGLVSK
ncbi:MAG: hypothetical protein QXG56_00810 [Candidatus Bathyarchaeia archaeon]